MAETFDAFRYISYLRARWQWIAASCAIALGLAFITSAIMPREYTATSRIVIESPAGMDPRSAIAVSPIYLESLKTYEAFASSDSLFRKAFDQFGLRELFGGRPIESVKRRVLKVGIVRNTRILEIAVSLGDARKAQALAKFLADATVDLSRSIANEGDQDLIGNIERQSAEARTKLQETEAAWARQLEAEPVRELQASMESAGELRSTIQQQILSSELEVADASLREKQAGANVDDIRKEAASARGRIEEMKRQVAIIDKQTAEREKLLAERLAHRDKLDAERKAEQTSLTALQTRLREARGEAGFRGERLRVIDPGIVPERPSSPNVPLNLAVALLLGLLLPVLYFTFELGYQEEKASGRRTVFHALAKARDE